MLAGTRSLILFADGCHHSPSRQQSTENGVKSQGGERKPTEAANTEDEECVLTKKRKYDRIPSLDRVANQGVSGWLSIRRHGSSGSKPGVALSQLLGVMPDRIAAAKGIMKDLDGFDKDSSQENKEKLNARYGGLEIRILSSHPTALELSSSLGASCELLKCSPSFMSADNDEKSSEAAAKAIAEQVQAHFDAAAEMIFVHLDASAVPGELATMKCLQVLDGVAKEVWGDGQQDVLQGVVVGGAGTLDSGVLGLVHSPASTEHHAGESNPNGNEESMGTVESRLEYLRPVQSTHVHNGRILREELDGTEQRLFYSLFHPHATRNDAVSALAPEDILQRGGNGGAMAQHWMMEIAFLLGKMPKYGA